MAAFWLDTQTLLILLDDSQLEATWHGSGIGSKFRCNRRRDGHYDETFTDKVDDKPLNWGSTVEDINSHTPALATARRWTPEFAEWWATGLTWNDWPDSHFQRWVGAGFERD